MEVRFSEIDMLLAGKTDAEKGRFWNDMISMIMEHFDQFSQDDIARLSSVIEQNKDIIGETSTKLYQDRLKSRHLQLVTQYSEKQQPDILFFS